VAAAALAGGEAALGALGIELFRPLQPMLAQSAEDVREALERLTGPGAGEVSFEVKLDGARVQVHRRGDEVRVFSRRLNEVTAAVPEVVEAALALPAREIILDGEVIALRPDGAPHPFQVTMRRFGRKLDVAGLRGALPLSPFFFDCLWLDGRELLAAPLAERVAALASLATQEMRVERLVTADAGAAEAFLRRTLAAGHEGVMAKALDAPYEAGSRGQGWLKVKEVKTLDLVVLAAEWGSGRRHGWLSNLHLGARDPAGGFVMLGKTFKGMTDEVLAWQTERLLALATRREGHVVHVRPELVVEIAYNDLQASPHYPGGLALRFARLEGYRPDRTPQDADTIDTVREVYRRATGG
jgi:DNA ligase 1